MINKVHGRDVSLELLYEGDYIAVGCATSISFDYENEIIRRTDVNAGLFPKKRARLCDFRGTLQGVILTPSTATNLSQFYLLQEAIRRQVLTWRFTYLNEDGDGTRIVGTFITSTIGISSDPSSFALGDINLEGTDGFEITPLGPPPEVLCPEWDNDYWDTSPGESEVYEESVTGKLFDGKEMIAVFREGIQHDPVQALVAPVGRQYSYDGTTVYFDTSNPFNPGEKVFLVWVK